MKDKIVKKRLDEDGNGEGEVIIYGEDGNRTRRDKGFFVDSSLMEGERIIYGQGGNKEMRIKGIFKDGRLNGQGKVIGYYENGNKHAEVKGIFENYMLNGQGEIVSYYQNGNKKQEYKGIFKDGRLNGQGKVIFYEENGNKKAEQKGIFKNGLLEDQNLKELSELLKNSISDKDPKNKITRLKKVIIELNKEIIKSSGGEFGVRDEGGIHNSIYKISSYLNKNRDPAKLGALILDEFAKRHYFNDGNKRTAYVTCKFFMLVPYGYLLKTEYPDAVKFILRIAEYKSKVNFEDIKKWLKENCESLSEEQKKGYLKQIFDDPE